jgi:hypothetical protein
MEAERGKRKEHNHLAPWFDEPLGFGPAAVYNGVAPYPTAEVFAMLKRSALIVVLLLVAMVLPVAPASAPNPAALAAKVDFENEALPARQKELLARYAEQVAAWASVQRIVKAIEEQNARRYTKDHILQIDRAWQRGEDPEGLASAIGHNDCAQALLAILAANPGYGEAFVTDAQGANVCMSRRTSDFWQGDEAKWIRSWAGGSGAIFVSKVAHDDSTKLDLMHISVPVRAGGRLIGVLIVGKLLAPS